MDRVFMVAIENAPDDQYLEFDIHNAVYEKLSAHDVRVFTKEFDEED